MINKKNFKVILGIALSATMTIPALANSTDVTIKSEVQDIISLTLERTSDSQIVSDDTPDPSTSLSSNEVIDFGKVNALGLETSGPRVVNRPVSSLNGTTGNLNAMVVDTSGMLYNADGSGTSLPRATNDGAVYMLKNALQLRVLRSGAIDSQLDVQQAVGGKLRAIVQKSSDPFSDGTTLSPNAFLALDGSLRSTSDRLQPVFQHNTPLPVDIGLHVPFTKTAEAGLTTKIIFTAL